jgi:hypothetical protein
MLRAGCAHDPVLEAKAAADEVAAAQSVASKSHKPWPQRNPGPMMALQQTNMEAFNEEDPRIDYGRSGARFPQL